MALGLHNMYSPTQDGLSSCQGEVFLEPEKLERGGGPPPKTAAEKLAFFWSRVKKGGPDECWDWQGSTANHYGQVYLGKRNGKQVNDSAHNVMWRLHHGDIPAGLVIRHRCDRTICLNPRHLLIGTQADNVEDARIQGKYKRPRPNGQKIRGEARRQVIAEALNGKRGTMARLARQHGVSVMAIYNIVKREATHGV
jgi:hypothetical protein